MLFNTIGVVWCSCKSSTLGSTSRPDFPLLIPCGGHELGEPHSSSLIASFEPVEISIVEPPDDAIRACHRIYRLILCTTRYL